MGDLAQQIGKVSLKITRVGDSSFASEFGADFDVIEFDFESVDKATQGSHRLRGGCEQSLTTIQAKDSGA